MTPEQWGRLTPPQQAAFIAQYGPPPFRFHRAPPVPQPQPRRGPSAAMLWLAGGMVLAIVVSFIGVVALARTRTITTTGSLMLNGAYGAGSKMATGAYPCVGTNGYDDIAQGTSVTMYDDAGKIVATSALDEGKALGDTGSCVFSMKIAGIPDGASSTRSRCRTEGR